MTECGARERSAILAALVAAGSGGATPAQAAAAAQLTQACAARVMDELRAAGDVLSIGLPPVYIAAAVSAEVVRRVLERLRARQLERPWLMGSTSLGLAKFLTIAEPALIAILAPSVRSGVIVYRSGYYATADYTPQLTAEQRAFFAGQFDAAPGRPPAPVPFEQLRAAFKTGSVPDLAQAFETLLGIGALVKVGDHLYRGAHVAALRAQLESVLEHQRDITVAGYRTLTGTSRKYAVPLLEFFDAAGLTSRSGDTRTLRAVALQTSLAAAPAREQRVCDPELIEGLADGVIDDVVD